MPKVPVTQTADGGIWIQTPTGRIGTGLVTYQGKPYTVEGDGTLTPAPQYQSLLDNGGSAPSVDGIATGGTAPATPTPTAAPTTATPTPTAPASAPTPTPPTPPPPSTPAPTPSQPTPPTAPTELEQAQQLTDQQFQQWLSQQNLAPDQKSAIQSIYGALGTNDQATADKILASFKAAKQYSDPYFAAQISLAEDALNRGLSKNENDLQFQEQSMANTLKDLQDTAGRSKDYLSFQQQQQLKDLGTQYGQNLDSLQNDLAARGFTTSSIRTKKEGILSDTYNGMVESTNRSFLNQTQNVDQNAMSANRDYQANLAHLTQLADQNKLDLLRGTEQQVGSTELGRLGYQPLGGIGGSIPQAQLQDQINFAGATLF